MKKMLYILSLTCLFMLGCDDGKSGSIYDDVEYGDDIVADNPSEVSDEDVQKNERPDDPLNPGGASGNESGNPSGSSGNKNDDSEDSDDSDEDIESYVIINDSEEKDDSESGNNESPDENFNGNGSEEDEELYYLWPEIESCTSGIPSDSEKRKVLNRINYIRSIHKLKPVKYDENYDEMTGECSLVIAANENLSHTPDSSWDCYSSIAYDGCYSSNINLAVTTNYDTTLIDSITIVNGFMTEENEMPPVTLGHRRWFIDPWLNSIAFGRADYSDGAGHFVLGSAIKVINRDNPNDQQDISDSDIEFVAYPFEKYPQELYNDGIMMSFTVIADKFSKFNNGETSINLDSATVAIINPDNKTMKIKSGSLATDYQGSGVPNNLRWYVEGIEPDVKYNVTIQNVFVNSNPKTYQYWFELK